MCSKNRKFFWRHATALFRESKKTLFTLYSVIKSAKFLKNYLLYSDTETIVRVNVVLNRTVVVDSD